MKQYPGNNSTQHTGGGGHITSAGSS